MLFSKEKWNNGKEMGAYVPTSASLSFEKVESSLQSADDLFLAPLLGDGLMAAIEAIYGKEDASRTPEERVLLTLAQRAEANLAFFYNFDALQLRITDQGFQRQGSDDWQQAYKYQEDRLRDGFRTKGFNAIDAMLDFLDDRLAEFPAYESAPAYTSRQKAIVRNTDEVQLWVNIGHSALMFLRFAAEFATVEETVLQATMGDAFYQQLLKWLNGDEEYPAGEYDLTLEQLRRRCGRLVVTATAVRLLKKTGTLTDRGLYFENVTAAAGENHTRTAASDAQIGDRLAIYERDQQAAEANLRDVIKTYYPDFSDGTDGHVIRDNDHHAAFFAM